MPTVRVCDLAVHPREPDLIIGTHGRGVFIADIALGLIIAGTMLALLGGPGGIREIFNRVDRYFTISLCCAR